LTHLVDLLIIAFMTKGQQIRNILQRGEWMLIADIAAEVGCTPPRVSQIFRELRQEGEILRWRPAGGRHEEYRLLVGDEATQARREKKRLEDERRRHAELRQMSTDLHSLIEAAQQLVARLDRLAT
jgi:hypothetical protein